MLVLATGGGADVLTFTTPGVPRPQGSMTTWRDGGGKTRTRYRPNVYEWRGLVTAAAATARVEAGDLCFREGPVRLLCVFRTPRPKSHYRTGKYAGELKESAPQWAVGGGDLDKYVRAIGDSLTDAGVWSDDGQVVAISSTKKYVSGSEIPGVSVRVERVGGAPS